MKYSKLLLVVSVLVLFGVTAVYAGDKCCKKAEKKCSAAVKACKDVNDSNAVKKCPADCKKPCCAKKQCAANRQNAEKCNVNAASKGEKKGWFASLFDKKQAQAAEKSCVKSDTKKCSTKCAKTCAAKCKAAKDANKTKCVKSCKKAKACQKPADPNASGTK